MVNAAYDSPVDFPPKEQIEEAETRLFSLAETDKYGQGFLGFNTALTNAIEMAGNAYKRDGDLSGIATGFVGLDGKMGGLQPSDLIILAGRPSMGKTALATNIAFNVARARLRSLTERRISPPTTRATTAPSSASSRWKCRPSSSPPASCRSRPAFPRRRSGAA